jgi:ABC-type dipeptide/oligopeptide/nickel transport system permease subunit
VKLTQVRRLGPGPLVLLMVIVAWLIARLSGYDVVTDVAPERASRGPSAENWLGTDHLGRDVWWRSLLASEAFVGPGLLACVVALTLGLPSGAVAGYRGGAAAALVRYAFAVIGSIPRMVLVLLACAALGNEPWVLAVAAGVAFAPGLGEAVYARIEALRQHEFVLAARAHGHSTWDIVARQLVWVNCRRLIGQQLLYLFGFVALLETTLSYIGGFGIEEPRPSWGNMLAFEFGISDGNSLAWLVPALAIWATLVATTRSASALAERVRD